MIGRSIGCDVLIEEPDISRRHAKVRRNEDDTFEIEDLESSNGTSVNGVRVQKIELKLGDKIRVADTVVLTLAAYDPVEEQILQRQRLETLGRLSAGLSHDFNNMQAVITAALDFLLNLDREKSLGDERVRDALSDVVRASGRASELARNLMSYARSDRDGYAIVDVSLVCEEVLKFVERTFDRRISVVPDIQSTLSVIGSSAELHQVLMNLCVNARDALAVTGELRVSVELATSGSITEMEIPPGLQFVLITVEDTGVGMDEQTCARLFEPFFSTKGAKSGYGLGLAMVKDIISDHGGTIDVKSRLGEGTAFRICLPTAPSARRRRAISEPSLPSLPQMPKGSLVLVADDEEMIRKSIGRVLEQAGVQVLYANDGLEVVRVYAAQTRRPDLVLLDLHMPNATGEEAMVQLRELDPDVRVVVVSGHHGGERERNTRSLGALGFVQKPFPAAKLLSAVVDGLNRSTQVAQEKTTLGRYHE